MYSNLLYLHSVSLYFSDVLKPGVLSGHKVPLFPSSQPTFLHHVRCFFTKYNTTQQPKHMSTRPNPKPNHNGGLMQSKHKTTTVPGQSIPCAV